MLAKNWTVSSSRNLLVPKTTTEPIIYVEKIVNATKYSNDQETTL